MQRMIEEIKAEYRHMRANALYVPWLAACVALLYLLAAYLE